MSYKPQQIISGGQTGADLGGLVAARRLNIRTGGTTPRGFRTECGTKIILRDVFGLREDASPDYRPRTKRNVDNADATVIFDMAANSPGSKLTIKLCEAAGKPYLVNPVSPEALQLWCDAHEVKTLNVAGNRESSVPGIAVYVANFIVRAFSGSAA